MYNIVRVLRLRLWFFSGIPNANVSDTDSNLLVLITIKPSRSHHPDSLQRLLAPRPL
jgi:hypothetical protein